MKLNLPETPLPAVLPCPFCGHPASLESTPVPDFSGAGKSRELAWHVVCNSPLSVSCAMGRHWLTSSAEKAAASWNQRTP